MSYYVVEIVSIASPSERRFPVCYEFPAVVFAESAEEARSVAAADFACNSTEVVRVKLSSNQSSASYRLKQQKQIAKRFIEWMESPAYKKTGTST